LAFCRSSYYSGWPIRSTARHVTEPELLFLRDLAYMTRGVCVKIVRALELSVRSRRTRSDIALWRRALSTLLLASFFWISYVAQTHIHGSPVLSAASTIVKSAHVPIEPTTKAPSNNRSDDSADCPLCQAASLGGALIIPLLFAVFILQSALQIPPRPAMEIIGASYFSCGHQTRAPPIL
jgi:hypothetical protein